MHRVHAADGVKKGHKTQPGGVALLMPGWEAEAGGLHVLSLNGLQREFKASWGNSVRLCLK